jgi:hypothetical protein
VRRSHDNGGKGVHPLVRKLAFAAWMAFVPGSAFAQATIAGTVKDASGGILPGVTVEATSPALIEKTWPGVVSLSAHSAEFQAI